MQQGIEYARLLDVPFVFATNGDGFIFRDAPQQKVNCSKKVLPWMSFHRQMNSGISSASGKATPVAQLPVITQDYYDDGSGKAPRYYQLQAINKTIEAVSAEQNRALLVMATGTRENLHRLSDYLALMESKKVSGSK